MKKSFITKLIAILFILSPAVCFSKEKTYSYELEFGNPKAQKVVQIGGSGDINITGYNGDKLLISANEDIFHEDNESDEKTKGLKKLGGGGFNITNDKEENCIAISRSIVGRKIDLDIKVPNGITLRLGSGHNSKQMDFKLKKEDSEKDNPMPEGEHKLFFSKIGPDPDTFESMGGSGIIAGNILIKDLTGTIEINTIQGNIDVENIKGEVVASSVQGNLKVIFDKLSKDNALYFSTVNGEIDITLPKGTAADIMAKTLNGNVYSGFDGETTTENVVNEKTGTAALQNIVNTFFHSNYITSKINGGGQDIYLSTINGNIYIRKGN
jgi:hypothetical protein